MNSKLKEISITEYKKTVEYLAKNKVEMIFPNPGERHASVVLANLFKYSEKSLTIYDKDLSGDLFGLNKDLYSEIEKPLKKEVNIIIENEDGIDDKLFQLLKKANIDIQLASEEFVNTVKKILGNNFYFAVGDYNKFRLESSEDERKAICSFNDSRYPKALLKILKETEDYRHSIV